MTSKSINNKMNLDLVPKTIKRKDSETTMTEFGALNWSILIVHIVVNLLLSLVIGKKLKLIIIFVFGKKPHLRGNLWSKQ
jgi:hypothetical protein